MPRLRTQVLSSAWLIASMWCLPATVHAQTISGEFFAGLGAYHCCDGSAAAWDAGGGLDVTVGRHISLGGTIGWIGPLGEGLITQTGPASAVTYEFATSLLLAFTARVHVARAGRVRPFVAVGIGEAIRSGSGLGGYEIGGGIDLWVRERRGIRIELRDHLLGEFGGTHLVVVRAGPLLRQGPVRQQLTERRMRPESCGRRKMA
jgi:hypothetical protein